MDPAVERARRTGPRELSVEVTPRYRVMRWLDRLVVRLLFKIRVEGLERWPPAPFCLVINHHNGWDPMLAPRWTTRCGRQCARFSPRRSHDFREGGRCASLATC